MKENNGWIKLHRKIKNWEGYPNIKRLGFFIYLLLQANWEDKQWQGIIIKRGSFVTSIKNLSVGTGLNNRQTRYLLSVMQSVGELSIKGTNKYTVISINNFDQYQGDCQTSVKQNGTRVSNKVSTTKEYKNNKKEKNNIYSEIILHFNETTGRKARKVDERAVDYWLGFYSLEEIKLAILKISSDEFWKDKMDLTILFRRKNPQGEAVDYISQLLNRKQKLIMKRFDTL